MIYPNKLITIRNGFTLIELLVVVAIIGILAAVGVVAFGGFTTGAKDKALVAQHKLIAKFTQTQLMKCDLGEANIKFNETFYTATWYCNYGNDWATISSLSQGFSRYFQYKSSYTGDPKNIITGENACCIGGYGATTAVGNHGIIPRSPNKIVIQTLLQNGSYLETSITKSW